METLAELPTASAYVFDTAPKGLLRIAGDRLPAGYRRQLARYRYNPGVFKVDWASTGHPLACGGVRTVGYGSPGRHVGGDYGE